MRKLYELLGPLPYVLLTMHSRLRSGGGHRLTDMLRRNVHVDTEPPVHVFDMHGQGRQERKVILQLTFTRGYQKSLLKVSFRTSEWVGE